MVMTWSVALPSSSSHNWTDIALKIATILRTLGFAYIPAVAWYYLIPIMLALEILMIVITAVTVGFFYKGWIDWMDKIKYAIYMFGVFFMITLLPMIEGISFFFECNWKTGNLQRDATLQCWNFNTGSGIFGLGLLLFFKKFYC